VLDASRRLFVDQGYALTTVAAVAAEAGVSVETVYKAFRNKPGLVKALVDVAIVGDDEPIPMIQREFVRRSMAETDPHKLLADYGMHIAEVAHRAGPMELVVRDAAAVDPHAAAVREQLDAERLAGMTHLATHLSTSGFLRRGVSVHEARDVLWTYNSVEMWDLLVNRRGWSDQRFGRWLGRQLIAALL
jgi:AcrR family transcriptional regulator